MFSKVRAAANTVLLIACGAIFAWLFVILYDELSYEAAIATVSIIFFTLSVFYPIFRRKIEDILFQKVFLSVFNKRIWDFAEKVRVSFSINNLVQLIKENLEEQSDFSVLWIDTENNSIIYNSPGKHEASPQTVRLLMDFGKLPNNVYWLNKKNRRIDRPHSAHAVMLVLPGTLFIMYSAYLKVFDPAVFTELYTEMTHYRARMDTIERMFALTAVSKEWELLGQTQRSFLPAQIPRIPGLRVSVFFQPLVNVSGDYYDIIPISLTKTLLILGDVSGKGLSAALIMGIIVNTIKVVDDKEDLQKVISAIDEAIKNMGFEAKFTAVFLGLLDHETLRLQYINAAMPDILIVSQDKSLRRMETTCPLIGLLDLDDFPEGEMDLKHGDTMIIASDGITEVEDEQEKMLGDQEIFYDSLRRLGGEYPQKFTQEMYSLVTEFADNSEIRDDLTVMIARVEER
ncbi:MAG: PP2C family protein-serine/threonine phosphatase [Spirochaetia bacterium]